MSVASTVAARIFGLPRRREKRVRCHADLPIPVGDGVDLLADRWYAESKPTAPTVLIRSGYGRTGALSVLGELFAERGYQAVIQSCRGTAGSGGEFQPFRDERRDGYATVAWLREQPWFDGTFATWGASYLGLTQWASAGAAPGMLRAICVGVAPADAGRGGVYPQGVLALESMLRWASNTKIEAPTDADELAAHEAAFTARLREAFAHLPLADGPSIVVGADIPFYRQWLDHAPDDPWWDTPDFRGELEITDAAVSSVTGWYDMFLPDQLKDFERLQARGLHPQLIVGPWPHGAGPLSTAHMQETFAWFDHHLLGRPLTTRAPVRLQPIGATEWLECDTWPPSGEEVRWHVGGNGTLSTTPAGNSAPDTWHYDPLDPTPGVGTASLDPHNLGPRDQRARRARNDVVSYTSEPFTAVRTFAGPVVAHLHMRSSIAHRDVHVTLCDVAPSGEVINICSGIVRLRDAGQDESTATIIELWPTAVTVQRGHRLALDVASGAHPMWARNLGTSEPIADATTAVASDHQLFHDPAHPSHLVLNEVSNPG